MRWSLVPRMVALALVVLAGVYYIAVDVLGVNLGAQPYTVTVMLPRAGGLYAEGDVTYRGVPVGKVSSLVLSTHWRGGQAADQARSANPGPDIR